MHRVIFEFANLSITSWGVMVVIAFIVGIWLAEKRGKKYGVKKTIISDLSIVLIIAGIVGGRLAFVVEDWSTYVEHPGEIFKIWEGGLIFYGGLLCAILFGIIYLKRKRVPVFNVMDTVAPSIALGLVFARIGCLLNGCCFGEPTLLPWGIEFPQDSPPRWVFDEGIKLHPTQVYSSIGNLCIFLLLLHLGKRRRKPGYLFMVFLSLYSGFRFLIDFIRHYEAKVYILNGFTHNQIISILLFLVSTLLWRRRAG